MSIEKAITGGTIMVEDAVKHPGYADINFAPSRRAKVELVFAVPEGENGKAYMEGVTRVADTKLTEMLNKKLTEMKADPAVEGAKPAAAKAKDKTPPKEKPVEKTKADLAREAGLPTEDTTVTTAVVDEDNLDDILGDAAPAARVISDKELGEIAGKVNAKKKAELGDKWAPAKIREIVAKFTGKKLSDVPKITEVPADKREEFVAALEAL